jgi:sigma-B regulation protein RsbU (phosphoserine phosphatase)
MAPGDALVLFTDGVVEASDSNDNEYGVDRLIHVVRTGRHLDPAALVDRIFTEIAEFAPNGAPADDQTVVVVKRRLDEPEEEPA